MPNRLTKVGLLGSLQAEHKFTKAQQAAIIGIMDDYTEFRLTEKDKTIKKLRTSLGKMIAKHGISSLSKHNGKN